MLIPSRYEEGERAGARWRRRAGRGLLAGLCVLVGYWLGDAKPIDRSALRDVAQRIGLAGDVTRVEPSLKTVSILVKKSGYRKMLAKRADALEIGKLISSSDDEVPAIVQFDDRTMPAKIRLKGDLLDHLEGDKWSFRVSLEGSDSLMGMRRFSLQSPATRNWAHEWLFHRTLVHEGLMGLRYDFVRVTLNERDLGVYALEEHFSKELIESSRRREGVIVRFDESLMWEPWAPEETWTEEYLEDYFRSRIDAFRSRRVLADPDLRRQFAKALSLLEAFRNGTLTTCQVFDGEKLARYLALVDLMGAAHSSPWYNKRYYYNPITSRLEPIGFDCEAGRITVALSYVDADAMEVTPTAAPLVHHAQVFEDVELVRLYVAELERVSRPGYLAGLFRRLDGELARQVRRLRAEYPDYELDRTIYERNRRFIDYFLRHGVGVRAFLEARDGDRLRIAIANTGPLPLEVRECRIGERRYLPSPPAILAPKDVRRAVTFSELELRAAAGAGAGAGAPGDEKEEIRVVFAVIGSGTAKEATVWRTPLRRGSDVAADLTRMQSDLSAFAFLRRDETSKSIVIRRGSWNLDRSLVVPKGYRLVALDGTELDLSHGASILCRAAVSLTGTESRPIRVYSSDGTGGGLAVLGASKRSHFEHVRFENLSAPASGGWSLTGAVSLHESPAVFRHCRFAASRAEDALNVIRGSFEVLDSVFLAAASDQLDGDFSTGIIRGCVFDSAGNDAIDLSASAARIASVSIGGASDKALSIGEGSNVELTGISVKRSTIGVAVKDSSVVSAKDLSIAGAGVGVAVYRKKAEFGPARLDVSGLALSGCAEDRIVQSGSRLAIDGRVQPFSTREAWSRFAERSAAAKE